MRSSALIALALVGACAGVKPVPAAPCALPVRVDVTASRGVNPDESAQPLPTVVRIVQLTHAVRAEAAEFSQLWEQLDETLGDQLVQKKELTIYPGTVEQVAVELDPKTRYLLSMAVFRVPTGSQWRAIVPLPVSEARCAAYEAGPPSPAIALALDGYRIEARSHLLANGDRAELPSEVTAGSENVQEEATR